jgi:hypothetical protein
VGSLNRQSPLNFANKVKIQSDLDLPQIRKLLRNPLKKQDKTVNFTDRETHASGG